MIIIIIVMNYDDIRQKRASCHNIAVRAITCCASYARFRRRRHNIVL